VGGGGQKVFTLYWRREERRLGGGIFIQMLQYVLCKQPQGKWGWDVDNVLAGRKNLVEIH
jgi:hypothetical protein